MRVLALGVFLVACSGGGGVQTEALQPAMASSAGSAGAAVAAAAGASHAGAEAGGGAGEAPAAGGSGEAGAVSISAAGVAGLATGGSAEAGAAGESSSGTGGTGGTGGTAGTGIGWSNGDDAGGTAGGTAGGPAAPGSVSYAWQVQPACPKEGAFVEIWVYLPTVGVNDGFKKSAGCTAGQLTIDGIPPGTYLATSWLYATSGWDKESLPEQVIVVPGKVTPMAPGNYSK